MKFSIATAVVAFAASVAALPPVGNANGPGAGNGVGNKGNSDVKFRVPEDMTIKQASEKCGDQAQLSCCNKVTWAGDTTEVQEGPLAGALSNLIGAGSGAEGLGIFDQCSKIDIPIVNIVNVQDLINKKCQQNIACCQNSPSEANGDLIGVGLPCIALGSLV